MKSICLFSDGNYHGPDHQAICTHSLSFSLVYIGHINILWRKNFRLIKRNRGWRQKRIKYLPRYELSISRCYKLTTNSPSMASMLLALGPLQKYEVQYYLCISHQGIRCALEDDVQRGYCFDLWEAGWYFDELSAIVSGSSSQREVGTLPGWYFTEVWKLLPVHVRHMAHERKKPPPADSKCSMSLCSL